MKEKQPTTGKFALNYGVMLALISITFSLMLFGADLLYDDSVIIKTIPYVMAIAVIVIALIQFKKNNNGFLTLSEALKIGAGIGLISALLGLAYFFLLSEVLEPEYMNNLLEIGKQKMAAADPRLTTDQLNEMVEMQKKFAWVSYPVILIINVLIGLVVSLIAGLIMKNVKPE
ncbi:MAG: DUF4199 domain-containing protein [Cellulophaga sp.]